MGPMEPPQAIRGAEKVFSYPFFSIIGIIMPPMAAVAAIAEPVMAAKNIQARMLTRARPLGRWPMRASAKSTIRLEMPP